MIDFVSFRADTFFAFFYCALLPLLPFDFFAGLIVFFVLFARTFVTVISRIGFRYFGGC